jgi:hypothetical protein
LYKPTDLQGSSSGAERNGGLLCFGIPRRQAERMDGSGALLGTFILQAFAQNSPSFFDDSLSVPYRRIR